MIHALILLAALQTAKPDHLIPPPVEHHGKQTTPATATAPPSVATPAASEREQLLLIDRALLQAILYQKQATDEATRQIAEQVKKMDDARAKMIHDLEAQHPGYHVETDPKSGESKLVANTK